MIHVRSCGRRNLRKAVCCETAVNPANSFQSRKKEEKEERNKALGVRSAMTMAGGARKMNRHRCRHCRMTYRGGRPMQWWMINSSSATRKVADIFLIGGADLAVGLSKSDSKTGVATLP